MIRSARQFSRVVERTLAETIQVLSVVPRAELQAVCAGVLTTEEFSGAVEALVGRGVVRVDGAWLVWVEMKEVV